MTQLGESIAFGMPGGDLECPFDHKKLAVAEKKNVMPRWGENSADDLGTALGNAHLVPQSTPLKSYNIPLQAHYTPHHLLPGEASWPNTELQKWADKHPGHVKENIGYDVNAAHNGVSLPGSKGYKADTGRAWGSYSQQQAYAFACMEATHQMRQFHDAHPAYNEFVIKVLDKVSEKLDAKIRVGGFPGCGKKDCAGDTTMTKKFDPPIKLLTRLEHIEDRLRGYLNTHATSWKMPIYTSRFALMYQMSLTEEAAGDALSQAHEDAKADKF